MQKLNVDDSTYWATDTRYAAFGDATRCKRRCIFLMTGHEDVKVTLPDGSRAERRTALCCQAVCFFSIQGVNSVLEFLHKVLPKELENDVQDDSLTFILLRYFAPHPLAFERDEEYRPLCPGPLRLNHCLWQFAKTSRCRQVMCDDDGEMNENVKDQMHVFGNNDLERQKCFEAEKYAYFGVLTPRSIKRRCNMTPQFCDNKKIDFSESWIETVTLL